MCLDTQAHNIKMYFKTLYLADVDPLQFKVLSNEIDGWRADIVFKMSFLFIQSSTPGTESPRARDHRRS